MIAAVGLAMALVGTASSVSADVFLSREFRIEGARRVRRVAYYFNKNIAVASFIGAKIAGQPRYVRARCVSSMLNLLFFDQIEEFNVPVPHVALTEHLRFDLGSDVACELLAQAVHERRESATRVRITPAGVFVR